MYSVLLKKNILKTFTFPVRTYSLHIDVPGCRLSSNIVSHTTRTDSYLPHKSMTYDLVTSQSSPQNLKGVSYLDANDKIIFIGMDS